MKSKTDDTSIVKYDLKHLPTSHKPLNAQILVFEDLL